MKTQSTITINLKPLQDMKQKLGTNMYVKVGVLSSGKANTVHKSKDAIAGTITNGEIAVIQEFGSKSKNIPARSFLRAPLEAKRKELLAFIASPFVRTFILEGNIKHVYKLLGLKAEAIVQEAFSTAGFGKWAPNAPRTIKEKGSAAPLIDTAQLRRSVTSEVTSKSKDKRQGKK